MPQKMDDVRATIVFDIPARCDTEELVKYIFSALESMGGCRHPEDPFFESLSVKSITLGNVRHENPKPKVFRR